jgi:hypothetical protein
VPQRAGGFPAVTVCTPYLALRDLGPNQLHRHSVANHSADGGDLHIANVIEIEHDKVGFAAVDARMVAKVTLDRDPPRGSV